MPMQEWVVLPLIMMPDETDPPSRADLMRQYGGSVTGVRDYWFDVSHGLFDVHFTVVDPVKVFYDLASHSLDRRPALLDACLKGARDAGRSVDSYQQDGRGIVYVANRASDLFGEAHHTFIGLGATYGQICHEVGHGLGLEHSWGATSPAVKRAGLPSGASTYSFAPASFGRIEYGDQSDIMSFGRVWRRKALAGLLPASHGPGLSGASLSLLGALERDQTVILDDTTRGVQVEIGAIQDVGSERPLVAVTYVPWSGDAPGNLHEYFVELRIPERWDEGIPNAGVLVHERLPPGAGQPRGVATRLYRDSSDPDDYPPTHGWLGGLEPPLEAGDVLVDPPRRLRVEVVGIDLLRRTARVDIRTSEEIQLLPQRFRAVNTWAGKHGYLGGYPNMHETAYGPGTQCKVVFLKPEAAEWRDIPAAELGWPETLVERQQRLHLYAVARGFVSGFANGYEAQRFDGPVYGAVLIHPGYGVLGQVPATGFRMDPLAEWWRAAHSYGRANTYLTGFPIYSSLTVAGEDRFLFCYLRSTACVVQNVGLGDLAEALEVPTRLRAAADLAGARHLPGAFPTFDDHDYGRGSLYGAVLFRPGSAEFRDIPVSELDPVVTADDRMRAVNAWASRNGYLAGFPTYHEATYGGVRVFGAVLLKGNVAEWRDVRAAELGAGRDFENRMHETNDWAVARGYLSGFPNLFAADYGPVAGTYLVRPTAGVLLRVPTAELTPDATLEGRIRAVVAYSTTVLRDRGFVGAFPTFADDAGDTTFVALLRGPTEFRDVPSAELGDPVTFGDRMRGAAKWATDHGYVGGFPTFMEAVRDGTKVLGLLLLTTTAAEWRDVPLADLGFPADERAQFRSAQTYATAAGFVGAVPNYFQAAGAVNGSVLIRANLGAEWHDLKASDLAFPS